MTEISSVSGLRGVREAGERIAERVAALLDPQQLATLGKGGRVPSTTLRYNVRQAKAAIPNIVAEELAALSLPSSPQATAELSEGASVCSTENQLRGSASGRTEAFPAPTCAVHNEPMVLSFYDRPGGPPGNGWVCRSCMALRSSPAGAQGQVQGVQDAMTRLGVHLSHCNFGEQPNACKYGEDNCPALTEAWSWFGRALQRAESGTQSPRWGAEIAARAEFGDLAADVSSQAGEPSIGLVNELEREIMRLNKEYADLLRHFDMYVNAWQREIGGYIRAKHHQIDGFVLRTRDALKEEYERGKADAAAPSAGSGQEGLREALEQVGAITGEMDHDAPHGPTCVKCRLQALAALLPPASKPPADDNECRYCLGAEHPSGTMCALHPDFVPPEKITVSTKYIRKLLNLAAAHR